MIFLLFGGCSKDSSPAGPPSDVGLNNPVFADAALIETGIPAFKDTVAATPTFTWRATGRKYVYLAVFTKNLVVSGGRIANTEDNIWAWHSGLGTGREGNVSFSDGVDVRDGVLQIGKPPTPLTSGNGYLWAVWAWQDDGTEIVASTKEMYFVVR
jgi:hypothetical protein